jgi:hypothetical protein
MALIINVSGSTKIDETTGLNDDDVASLPSNVSTAFSNAGVNLALAIQFAGGGGDDVTVTPDSGFTVNGLGFVDATNGALDGDASGLFTLENRQIFLYAANNDNVVLGREGTLAGVADPAGTIVFAIYLEETTTGSLITGGKFWTALFEPLKHTDANDHDFTVNLDNKLKVAATESTTFLFDNAPSGANEFMMFGNNPGGVSTSGIVVTGRAPDANTEDNNHKGDTVSSSQAGPHATIGVNGQHLGPGDGLNFTMVTNPVADFTVAPNSAPERLDSTEADHEGNIQFGGYAPGVTSASFTVAQVNPTGSSVQIKISAFNDPNGAAGETGTGFVEGFADDVAVNITEVKINGVVVAADLSGNTAVISGVVNGDVITYTTSAHTRVLIENVQPTKGPGSNITLDIGGFSILSSQGASEFAGTQLQFDDDGPTITAVASTASVRHDETAGVQADTDVPGSDIAFPGTTITSLFTNVPSPGDDPHVPGTGAIGFARSTSPLLTVTGSAGTDGPAAQELSYALSVSDSTDSGVETTAGTKIFMFNGTGNATGLILGRVGTENANADTADPAGTVAFALATNPATGEVFLAQYLSLKHPTGGTSYDETITLAAGAVQMSVIRTDGDGDTATDSDNNIGLLVKFDDDGPTISPAIADGQVAFANGASDGDTGFLAYGADGPASVGPFKITAFEAMPDNTPLGPITETLSSNDTVLTYSSATHGDLFSLTLDATAPGGYTFTVLQDVPTILNVLDFGSVNPGGPVEEITIAAPGGTNVTFDGFLASDFDGNPTTLKAQFGTGDLDPNPIEDVNVSTQGIGLKDNQMDPNVNAAGQDEALKMSFSQDVDGVQIVFDGATGGGNTFDATFEAYDDGVLVDTITFSGLAAPKGNNTTTVTFNPDPAHDFDELYIGLNLADKSGLRIHQVATIEKADIPDFALDYTVRATDGDADTASDMFTVKIDSNLDGTITV